MIKVCGEERTVPEISNFKIMHTHLTPGKSKTFNKFVKSKSNSWKKSNEIQSHFITYSCSTELLQKMSMNNMTQSKEILIYRNFEERDGHSTDQRSSWKQRFQFNTKLPS